MILNKNKLSIGLIIGILSPIVIFLIVYLINYDQYSAMINRGVLSVSGVRFDLFLKIGSLCVIPNLLIFFYFTRQNALYSARGVLLATFIITFVVMGLYYIV